MDTNLQTAAAAVAAEAAVMSRIAAGDERRAIMAIARALRDPQAVARLVRDERCPPAPVRAVAHG